MKRHAKAATKRPTRPTRPTAPTPPPRISRREAFKGGNPTALFDELSDAFRVAVRKSERKPIAAMPALPDGSRDARPQPDDPVTLPYWAFEAVFKLATVEMSSRRTSKGKYGRAWKQYRENLKHWHRYCRVKEAMAAGGTQPHVFADVADDLHGTSFAGKASTVETSYKDVLKALKTGDAARFYRSTAAAIVYELLLAGDAVEVIRLSVT